MGRHQLIYRLLMGGHRRLSVKVDFCVRNQGVQLGGVAEGGPLPDPFFFSLLFPSFFSLRYRKPPKAVPLRPKYSPMSFLLLGLKRGQLPPWRQKKDLVPGTRDGCV